MLNVTQFARWKWRLGAVARATGLRQPYCGRSPNIVTRNFAPIDESLTRPLLIVVGPLFDETVPNANFMVRQGMAHGWTEVCGPAYFVDVASLEQELDRHQHPSVYLGDSDMRFVSRAACCLLRQADTFIWVGPHPNTAKELRRRALGPSADSSAAVREGYRRILDAEPKFVWAPFGKDGQQWLDGWRRDGLRVATIFDAADPRHYYPNPALAKYGSIRMAYVGGYWAEKARGFEQYLRPWEEELVPFGYTRWPYRHYAGRLTQSEERQLYSSAGLIPLVTSPIEWEIAEPPGRYFKAAACGAFCIADHNPVVRELYGEDEMLQANSPEHFHELVREFLAGRIDVEQWRKKALAAVTERHLYRHRVEQIVRLLDE